LSPRNDGHKNHYRRRIDCYRRNSAGNMINLYAKNKNAHKNNFNKRKT
jgi:hypothetical protein